MENIFLLDEMEEEKANGRKQSERKTKANPLQH